MGIQTPLNKAGDSLIIDIPKEYLPAKKIVAPEVDETREYVPLIVRRYQDRTALSLTYSEGISPVDAMTTLGFDPWQPSQILPYGATSDRWLNSHLFHGFRPDIGRSAYGRVWIPPDLVKALKIRRYDVYPALIRGWTPMRYKEDRMVVTHFGRQYLSTEQGQWIPPRRYMYGYDILKKAKDTGIQVYGDFHKFDDKNVSVDFLFDPNQSRYFVSQTGSAYRYMTLRNYTSQDPKESAKYLLCEIRATMLVMYPREYYQEAKRFMTLMDALRITVKNLSMFFTQSIRYAEKIGEKYQKEHGVPLEPPKVEYETMGEEENVQVSAGETMGHPFYYVEKYVRITNEQSVRRKQGRNVRPMDRRLWNFFQLRPETRAHIYDNNQIEEVLTANPFVEVDKHGMVWIRRQE